MIEKLKSRILLLRNALESREDGIKLGEFRPGVRMIADSHIHPSCAEFFSISDGGRFGSIDLWSHDELAGRQFRAEVKPGGSDQWVEFGQVVYEPIFVHRSRGIIELPSFLNDGTRTVKDFDTFLEEFVFGKRYGELFNGAANDRWYEFLMSVDN